MVNAQINEVETKLSSHNTASRNNACVYIFQKF
jgi:hypothetical protein